MNERELYAILLAAGAGRRYGGLKQLAAFGAETLLQRALTQAASVCDERVLVVIGAEATQIRNHLNGVQARPVENPGWKEGIASSVRAGVKALPSDCPGALILLCDQPMISTRSLKFLVAHWQEASNRIVACRYGGTVGVPAIFPRRWFHALLKLRGDAGAKSVIRSSSPVLIDLPEAEFDIDWGPTTDHNGA